MSSKLTIRFHKQELRWFKATCAAFIATPVVIGGCVLPGLLDSSGPGAKGSRGSLTGGGREVEEITRESQVNSVRDTVLSLQSTIKELNLAIPAMASNVSKATSSLLSDSRPGKYRLQGQYQDERGTTVVWDDFSKALVEVYDAKGHITFAFTGKGQSERSAQATLKRSEDGTTGHVKVVVAAEAWVRAIGATESHSIGHSPSPEQVGHLEPGNEPTPAPTPPFEFLPNNEIPDFKTLSKVEIDAAVTPKGDTDNKLAVEVTTANFKTLTSAERAFLQDKPKPCPTAPPSSGGISQSNQFQSPPCETPPPPPEGLRLPTSVRAHGRVPRLKFDQNADWKLGGANQLLASTEGTLDVDTGKKGIQSWKTKISARIDKFNEQNSQIDFDLENTTQKFRLVGTVTPKKGSNKTEPFLSGKFESTENKGELLATVTMDPTKGDRYPTVEFADDGAKMVLKLDEGISGQSPPPLFPSTRPVTPAPRRSITPSPRPNPLVAPTGIPTPITLPQTTPKPL